MFLSPPPPLLDRGGSVELFCCLCSAPGLACRNGDVRLQDGEREGLGRVEVCLAGQWSTMCGYYWDNPNARVVCRQLGFNPASKEEHSVAFSKLGLRIIPYVNLTQS